MDMEREIKIVKDAHLGSFTGPDDVYVGIYNVPELNSPGVRFTAYQSLWAVLFDEREAHRETKSNLYSMTQDRNHFQRELSDKAIDSISDGVVDMELYRHVCALLGEDVSKKKRLREKLDTALARVKELEAKLAVKEPDEKKTWKPHVVEEIRKFIREGGVLPESVSLRDGFCRGFNCDDCPCNFRAACPIPGNSNQNPASLKSFLDSVEFPWRTPEPVEYACPECRGKTFWHSRKCGRERQLTCNNDHDSCGARSGWFPSGVYYPRWLKKRPPDEKKAEQARELLEKEEEGSNDE